MKIRITLKDPDGVSRAIQDAIGPVEDEFEVKEMCNICNWSDICKKWIKWGEYVTIEIDTDNNTAIVIPNDK